MVFSEKTRADKARSARTQLFVSPRNSSKQLPGYNPAFRYENAHATKIKMSTDTFKIKIVSDRYGPFEITLSLLCTVKLTQIGSYHN